MKCLIFGCGYLGSVVAQIWHRAGHSVHVVTRSDQTAEKFRDIGYKTTVGDVTDPNSLDDIAGEFDVCLYAVGFDRSRYNDIRDVYVVGFSNVLNVLADRIGHFIYISSTGVFGDCEGNWVDENTKPDPHRPGGKACLEAESLLKNSSFRNRYTILRLAGIYGPNRIPRLQAIEKQDWAKLGKSGHINLIHVADAAKIVNTIAINGITEQLFLVSDGQAVERKSFYEFVADRIGSGPIDWSIATDVSASRRASADKKISNRKLVEFTAYQFQFPSFQTGITQSINESS